MRKFSVDSLSAAFFYAVALFFISLFRDNLLQPDIFIRVSEFLSFPISSDPRTFAGAGVEMSEQGWLTPQSMWIFHLWPPGFAILLGGIFAVFGTQVPFLAVLLVLTVLCCTFMLLTVRRYLSLHVPEFWALVLPLLPFAFPVTRFFLLQPVGLAFGEGFSVIFFITSIFLLLLAVEKKSIFSAVLSGVFLSLAAYFRSQYELLAVCMFAGAIALALGGIAWRTWNERRFSVKAGFWGIGLVVVAMLVAQILMLPWRIHNLVDAGTWSWVQTEDLVARNGLASEEKLLSMGGKFVVIGGGNLACKFEPSYCDKEGKSLFYQAFFQNLPDWLMYKASFFEKFWFADVEYFPEVVDLEYYPGDYWGNSIILLFVAFSFVLVFVLRKSRSSVVYLWAFLSFYGCFLIVFSLVQLEVRYFYLIKIFAMFSLMALVAAVRSLGSMPAESKVVAPVE
ncbi:hypothetical protein [Variovorax boronicumulans]